MLPILKSTIVLVLLAGVSTNTVSAQTAAGAEADTAQAVAVSTTTITGQLRLPGPEVFAGVDREGLSLADVVVRLEGTVELQPYPTPDDWEDYTREEQIAWTEAFRQTEAYGELVRQNEAAKAARTVMTTGLDEDGAFRFEGVGPDAYKLEAMIMHSSAGDAWSWHLARAYKTERFTIDADAVEPVELGRMMMWIRNVLVPGDPAPIWTGTDYEGTEVSLTDFRGKYVLMDFWATWCGPCLAEVPNIEAVYADYAGERFEIVGLCIDNTIDLPRDYHAEHPSPYPQVYLGKWNEETATRDYGVHGIPSVWLIGPDGTIIARDLRGEALRAAVREALRGSDSNDAAEPQAGAETDTD